MQFKIFLGLLSTVIALFGYFLYLKSLFSNSIKPHAFSWFVWGLMLSIVFAVQVSENAGPGSWVTGLSMFFCFVIASVSVIKKYTDFNPLDWISLVGSILALILWVITKNPLLSIILIIIVDTLGFIPTVYKGYRKPLEENHYLFMLSGIKFIIAIIALDSFSINNWIYPGWLAVTNIAFSIMLIVRKQGWRVRSYN